MPGTQGVMHMRSYRSILSGAAFSALVLAGGMLGASQATAQESGNWAGPRTIWEGFHFGVHAGFTDNDYGVSQTAPVIPLATIDDSADGVIAGIVYGSSYQIDNWVVGTDSEWSWSDTEAGPSVTGIAVGGAAAPVGTGPFAATVDIDYSSASRIRAGYLVRPNLMVYGALGIAFARVDVSGSLIAGGGDDKRFTGFQYGGGIETTLQNRFFARLEYLHTDFGDEDFTDVGGGIFNVDLDSDTVRGAVGYRFDWSPFDLLTGGR